MINPERLQTLLLAYSEEAKLFFYSYGLANLVLDLPIDHVAIKALNREIYEQCVQLYLPLTQRLSYAVINERHLATTVLLKPLDAGTFGKVSLLEIMEPRPGAIATTYDLIDHIELLAPNLELIKQALVDGEVEFKIESNDNHTSIVIEINEWGQEVKFTDRSIGKVADEGLNSGSAKLISTVG